MSASPSRNSAAGWSRTPHAGVDLALRPLRPSAGPASRLCHQAGEHLMQRLMQQASSALIRALPEDMGQDAMAAARPAPSRPGPGPSRIAYRLSRIWMKASVRRAAVALPLLLTGLIVVRMAGDPKGGEAICAQLCGASEAPCEAPEW